MANQVTVAYEKAGKNFKTTIFNVAFSGNYAAPEVVTLTTAESNPDARTVTGPAGTPPIAPRVVAHSISGYVPKLAATATPGEYDLTFAYGATALNGAYNDGDFAVIEVDHDLQGY